MPSGPSIRPRAARDTRALLIPILVALAGVAGADVSLPHLFADHMVLQRGREVRVWGKADAGEAVTVRFRGEESRATAGDDGRWEAWIGPLAAGGPDELVVSGKNEIKIADVLVGEVWVCSGQSNMQWSVKISGNPEAEIAAANHPNIRLFQVPMIPSDTPFEDVDAKWAVCSPESIPDFSAVGYYFGRSLQAALGVPVGLIQSAWGGTPAEAWTRRERQIGDPEFQPIVDRWDAAVAALPAQEEQYAKDLAAWETAAKEAEAAGQKAPDKPKKPAIGHQNRPGTLYNGMIAPLVPFTIAGAIWYQGESNAGRAFQYRRLFPEMIRDWRESWGQGDFPFLFVQLANFLAPTPEPVEAEWAELREAQNHALRLPKTGMAVIIDIGEEKDIHPKNKQDVGARLALAARMVEYGHDVEGSSPLPKSIDVRGGEVLVKFEHVGGGLKTRDGKAPRYFSVAGPDRKFHWAEATVVGPDTVSVRCAAVPNPVAVRHAWANNPDTANLIGGTGLPASPFRSDDWRGLTRTNF